MPPHRITQIVRSQRAPSTLTAATKLPQLPARDRTPALGATPSLGPWAKAGRTRTMLGPARPGADDVGLQGRRTPDSGQTWDGGLRTAVLQRPVVFPVRLGEIHRRLFLPAFLQHHRRRDAE